MPFPLFRIGLPILLVASAATSIAQSTPHPPQHSAASAPPSNPSASSAYRSAFAGYRAFSDQSLTPWRQSNDAVGQIGGWQVYAREGQGKEPDAPSAASKQTMQGMDMPGMSMPAAASTGAAALSPASAPPVRKAP